MSTDRRYPATVFWSDEDGGYIAIAKDLPGCSAFGETEADALSELKSATSAWIIAATAAGNPIPEPTTLTVEPTASGKMLLRLPRSLHSEVLAMSKAEAVSANQFVAVALASVVAAKSVAQSVRQIGGIAATDAARDVFQIHSAFFDKIILGTGVAQTRVRHQIGDALEVITLAGRRVRPVWPGNAPGSDRRIGTSEVATHTYSTAGTRPNVLPLLQSTAA